MLTTNENTNTGTSQDKPISMSALLSDFSKTKEGQVLLAKYPNLFTKDNFNVVLTEGEDAGKTLLWFLASEQEGRMLITNYSELLKQGNLDAAPTSGSDAGTTILWWLAGYPDGRTLLAQQPELLKKKGI